MKKLFLTTVISFVFLSLAVAQQDVKKEGGKIPSVEIKDLEGNVFNTSDIQNDGSPIILDFWATWCKPCIKELMALDENYDDWQEETGVKIFIFSVDDSRSMNNVAPFVNGKGWEFEAYLDPNSDFKRALGIVDVPHTFILDGDGNIVHEHTAYTEGDEEKYHEILLDLVEQQKEEIEPDLAVPDSNKVEEVERNQKDIDKNKKKKVRRNKNK